MSDEEHLVSETQVLTAEFKDGQLEIVEVTPFENNEGSEASKSQIYAQDCDDNILPDMADEESETQFKVLDSSKGLLQLDLLNLTLVKCADGDGEESYRLVSNQEADELGETVTCVLQSSDGEEGEEENQNAYVSKKQLYLTESGRQQYVVVNGEKSLEQSGGSKKLSAVELLERAKALQKAKSALSLSPGAAGAGAGAAGAGAGGARRGRKRRGALPPPHELLASPAFKLFLYSCKLCSFKCNAIRDLTAHKAAEHSEGAGGAGGAGGGAGRARGARAAASTLQCARCPFRGAAHAQLMKHVQDKHLSDSSNTDVYLESAEAAAADVLVCGACGFESASRAAFRAHIARHHAP